jgi:hypothetical protein
VTPRYHFQSALLLLETGQSDGGSREIYRGFDMTREPVRNCYRLGPATHLSTGAAHGREAAKAKPAFLTIVVIAGGDFLTTAGVLSSLASQIRPRSQAEIIVVDRRSKRPLPLSSAFAARWPALRVRIATPGELAGMLRARAEGETARGEDFVVITTDGHQLPPDWLAWLDAYIANAPEADFFYGETTHRAKRRGHVLKRETRRQGRLAGAAFGNWACRTAILARCGGWPSQEVSLDDAGSLTDRILKAGARALNAPEWQSVCQPEAYAVHGLTRSWLGLSPRQLKTMARHEFR